MAKKDNKTPSPINGDTCEVVDKNVRSFLGNELLSYSKYVIETRTMPSIMDGLRIGARKITWAAMTGDLKSASKVKMMSLIGDTFKLEYHHGDSSLLNTVIQLGSTHLNRFAPLEIIGQIGSLRNPECKTAPRYMHVRKSPFMEILRTDMELLEIKVEEGIKTEPRFFLPVIPMTLVWRTSSPGFGFGFRVFSYSFDNIIDNCITSILEGKCDTPDNMSLMKPQVEEIKDHNMIYNQSRDSWYNVGESNIEGDMLIVTDLPYDVSFQSYEEHLNTLVDENYIESFQDLSSDNKIRYIIKFSQGRLKVLERDKWSFYKKMLLYVKVTRDTLNCLDSDGKTILHFDNPYQLIDAFVKRRIVYYSMRKDKTIKHLENMIDNTRHTIKFIKLVNDGSIVISRRKVEDIKVDLDKYSLPHELLDINVSKLSLDGITTLETLVSTSIEKLEYIQGTPVKEMYISDLIDIKKKYSGIEVFES
jgi:DNA topoisomerase-2